MYEGVNSKSKSIQFSIGCLKEVFRCDYNHITITYHYLTKGFTQKI